MNTTVEEVEVVSLTAQDRCDRCSAQALSVARKDDFELLFCKHHERESGPALLTSGWRIIADESQTLD
jgi:hypothetical protein